MAFLDNSGDIILDAVLTDSGRRRLAQGDGSFKISKFAIGDTEIDYGLYNIGHASGSAYYDLEILQMPVLEATTNASIGLKSKLVSYADPNLLYLPVLKVNTVGDGTNTLRSTEANTTDLFVVAVDQTTANLFGKESNQPGILDGVNPTRRSSYVRIDHGLDTQDIPKDRSLPPDMREVQFSIQMDRRLGFPVSVAGNARPNLRFIDNDNIASYILGGLVSSGGGFVSNIPRQTREEIITKAEDRKSTLLGPPGTKVEFKIQASLDLQSDKNATLFKKIGGTSNITDSAGSSVAVYHIDTNIRLTAISTGYTLDIPVRFIKKQ